VWSSRGDFVVRANGELGMVNLSYWRKAAMKQLKLCHIILVGALAMLALTASAQADSMAPPHGTPTTKLAPASQQQDVGPRKPVYAAKHHAAKRTAKAHKARHVRHNAVPSNQSESAYRAALRQCVEGLPAHRDGCLDDTIARFGRAWGE
jgi:hypothetical protein